MLKILALILISSVCFGASAKSHLEIGAGVFTMKLPHYPGAEQHKTYVLPTPYIYYSSDTFKVDRNQFTGFLWKKGNLHLDISAGAGISINSDDNRARQDMPDLDWVLELGPSLKYYLSGDPQSDDRWYGEIFARKAIATDFRSIDDVGWRYGPSMTYQRQLYNQDQHKVMLTVRANANFSDAKYLDYYYAVPSEYETAQRQTYHTETGYAGSDLSVGLTYKSSSYFIGGFVRYYGLDGATVQDSPLFFNKNTWSAGLGFVWIFYHKNQP